MSSFGVEQMSRRAVGVDGEQQRMVDQQFHVGHRVALGCLDVGVAHADDGRVGTGRVDLERLVNAVRETVRTILVDRLVEALEVIGLLQSCRHFRLYRDLC